MIEFAPQYPRDSAGIIHFPSDRTLRMQYWPNSSRHPAAASILMVQEIVRAYSQPGDVILDPMAGTGTLMIGALEQRTVWLIELEQYFYDYIVLNRESFPSERVRVLHGDCRVLLPVLAAIYNLVCFSPPYSDAIKPDSGMMRGEKFRGEDAAFDKYTDSADNLARLPQFQFDRAMVGIYEKCLHVLKPGGYMVLIIKDRMEEGARVQYGLQHTRLAMRAGFTSIAWHKRENVGQLWGRFNKNRGIEGVEDEHIIVFQRPAQ